jgi:hypothetical protein
MTRNERTSGGVCAAMRFLVALLALLALLGLAACAGTALPAADAPVVTIEFHGGLCADGGECRSVFVIRGDGMIVDPTRGDGPIKADPGQFARMLSAIASTDLQAMKARPFTGTCPIAFDGQEAIFTFRLAGGDLRLASCESELDPEHELFRAIREVLRAAEGPTN